MILDTERIKQAADWLYHNSTLTQAACEERAERIVELYLGGSDPSPDVIHVRIAVAVNAEGQVAVDTPWGDWTEKDAMNEARASLCGEIVAQFWL